MHPQIVQKTMTRIVILHNGRVVSPQVNSWTLVCLVSGFTKRTWSKLLAFAIRLSTTAARGEFADLMSVFSKIETEECSKSMHILLVCRCSGTLALVGSTANGHMSSFTLTNNESEDAVSWCVCRFILQSSIDYTNKKKHKFLDISIGSLQTRNSLIGVFVCIAGFSRVSMDDL